MRIRGLEGIATLGTLLALAACREPTSTGRDISETTRAVATEPRVAKEPDAPTCAAQVPVEEADVVRLDGGFAYYASEAMGLGIFRLSEEGITLVSRSAFTGTPRAVFVVNDTVFVVFTDWDPRPGATRAASTVIRALDAHDPWSLRLVGEERSPGYARGAVRIGDTVVIARTSDDAREGGGSTTIASYTAHPSLVKRSEVELPGGRAALVAAREGLVVARHVAGDETALTWLDVSAEGTLLTRASISTPGVAPLFESSRALDLDEDRRLAVVACATRRCASSEPRTVSLIDFAMADAPKSAGTAQVPGGEGPPVARFVGTRLVLAQPDSESSTRLHVLATDRAPPLPVGSIRVRGIVGSFLARPEPRSEHIVTLGWTSATTAVRQAVIHDVAMAAGAPVRVTGSATFGSDWTWSPAYDDDRAVSFSPGSELLALPLTTWSTDRRYATGAEIVSLGPHGAAPISFAETDAWLDRVVFSEHRLLGFGDGGVTVIDFGDVSAPRRMHKSWAELAP